MDATAGSLMDGLRTAARFGFLHIFTRGDWSFCVSLDEASQQPVIRTCGRVSRVLQACRLRLTNLYVLAYNRRNPWLTSSVQFLPPDAILQQSNANFWLVCRTLNLLPAVRLLVACLRASLSKIAFVLAVICNPVVQIASSTP
jgi:hypothetical protein